MQPDTIVRRHIRPALERIGVAKRIGRHSFRHRLGTMLRQRGVELKTVIELLRHANSRITLEIYQQAVGEEKRLAQNLAFRGLLEGGSTRFLDFYSTCARQLSSDRLDLAGLTLLACAISLALYFIRHSEREYLWFGFATLANSLNLLLTYLYYGQIPTIRSLILLR